MDEESVIICHGASFKGLELADIHDNSNNPYYADEGNRVHKTESGSFVLTLPTKWYGMRGHELVGALLETVEANVPYLVSEGVNENGISLRDDSGVRVDLQLTLNMHNIPQSVKMRRLAGNELQYTQICQQLIDCITI